MSRCGARRRAWLGVLVAACALATVFGGSASATLSLDTATDTNITIDGDVHWFSGQQQPFTSGAYQYFAYWDADDTITDRVYLKITRRRLSDDRLETLRFDQAGDDLQYLENETDGHNSVGLGISPIDGRIHISWSLHRTSDSQHRYMISATNCMTVAAGSFTLANCRFRKSDNQASRSEEADLTYPIYFNDAAGHLYFAYRWDSSANGDHILNVYNDNGTWTERGRVIDGHSDGRGTYDYTFDPDGAGPARSVTSRTRGSYVNQWEFDKNGRLHVMWVWREAVGGEYVTNHGVYYAYSDDLGRTWYSDAGALIATTNADRTRDDPITILDRSAVQVISKPPGWNIGSTGFQLDSNNNPHVVKFLSDTQTDDITRSDFRQTHFWRTTDHSWYSQAVEAPGDGRNNPTEGDILIDRSDSLYYIFARNDFGWVPWNSNIYVQADLPTPNVTWQSGRYMDVQLHSRNTCLDTNDYVGSAIS